MKRTLLTVALLVPMVAFARPLLIAPQRLVMPTPPPPYPASLELAPEYSSVAIDGNTVMASANRALNTDNDRINGVYIWQRDAGGHWNYSGPLTEGSPWPENVVLGGDVAAVRGTDSFRIYERGTAGWTLAGTFTVNAAPFRIENGSVFTSGIRWPPDTCPLPHAEYRKVNGSWQQVATLGGERCDDEYPEVNDGRALIIEAPYSDTGVQEASIFRKSGNTWPQVASIPPPPPEGDRQPEYGFGTIEAPLMYLGSRYLFRNTGGDNWIPIGTLTPPEQDLGVNASSSKMFLRGGNLLILGPERDYELPSHDIDYTLEWRTIRVYRPRTNGTFEYFARLNPDFDIWHWDASDDGRRVVATSPNNNIGYDPAYYLYVFEIPDTHAFPTRQQDNFQSGNFARWTPTAGQFSVVRDRGTRVLRQASLAGNSGARLTAIDWTDQSIEADIRPLEFSGNGRWFGLVTRRIDNLNYYYVTFRQPNVISLRRYSDGAVTEIARGWAPENFVAGRNYRVRLESVGDQHAAFVDGIPRAFGKDTTHTHGQPGVAGYRTRYDVDNVIVTGGTRYLMLHDGMENFFNSRALERGSGTWIQVVIDDEQDSFHSYRRQTDTSGNARVFSRTPLGDQVVIARMQPVSYGSQTGNAWFGIAARVVDGQNYLYMSLRRSGELSLRRVVNGAVQIIATVPVPVNLNQWYDLRLETFGSGVRAFVNGDLKIETAVSGLQSSGASGVVMYRTSADLWTWITYQP